MIIKNKKEIDEIIVEKIKWKKVYLTDHCINRAMWRGIDEEKIFSVLPRFDKVFVIETKILKYGDEGYELFYELGRNNYFAIAMIPEADRLKIVHVIEYKRNIKQRFS